MTLEEFLALSIEDAKARLKPELVALLLDKRGDWSAAHDLADSAGGRSPSRVHAYLHRKEGNVGNARYWYRHVKEPEETGSVDAEWDMLVRRFLESS
jgi:hypothetical protein